MTADKYIGRICKNGHDPCWRYSSSRQCVECLRDWGDIWRIENLERKRQHRRNYYKNHPERHIEQERKRRAKNPERQREKAREFRERNPVLSVLYDIKKRAKKNGYPFDLTLDNIPPVPSHCPVFDIPLIRSAGKPTDNTPSLDRIIPALGYVAGNIHWISFRANILKRDATVGELRKLADYFEKLLAEKGNILDERPT